jgi:hypothetical protein
MIGTIIANSIAATARRSPSRLNAESRVRCHMFDIGFMILTQ